MALDITGAGAVSGLISDVVTRIWPDKTEAEKQQLAAAVQLVQGQLEINKVEAASSSVFVSGWRPFIGWVCGAACAWNWIGLPILRMYVPDLTPANLTEMMPVLMGLLGLGALRTVEKINNVASR
jgi:hypothetical protein